MSELDRRTDPRAEEDSDDDTGPHYVERPFHRELPGFRLEGGTDPQDLGGDIDPPSAEAPSTSQVRAVTTPLPFAPPTVEALDEMPGPQRAPGKAVLSSASSTSELANAEHLVDQGDWVALAALLGAEKGAELPPHLALLHALAMSESRPDAAGEAIQLAIHSVARAHGLAETSPIARVIAKRLLRRTPANWRKRPAPPKKISIALVAVALILGGGGGFWLSTTSVKIPIPGLFAR